MRQFDIISGPVIELMKTVDGFKENSTLINEIHI